jgi:hypothetical protein
VKTEDKSAQAQIPDRAAHSDRDLALKLEPLAQIQNGAGARTESGRKINAGIREVTDEGEISGDCKRIGEQKSQPDRGLKQ